MAAAQLEEAVLELLPDYLPGTVEGNGGGEGREPPASVSSGDGRLEGVVVEQSADIRLPAALG